jgi:hypothetical protein
MRVHGKSVKGVLFDFGNTLFAHAPLALTIGESAVRLGLQIGEDDLVAIAHRIDSAAMTAEELMHPRPRRLGVEAALAGALRIGRRMGPRPRRGDQREHARSRRVDPVSPVGGDPAFTARHGFAVGIVSNTGWNVRDVFAEPRWWMQCLRSRFPTRSAS